MIEKKFLAAQKRAIARGVKWLDSVVGPSWPFQIKLKSFDIVSCCRCVLGQIGRSQVHKKGYGDLYELLPVEDRSPAAYHGFDFTNELEGLESSASANEIYDSLQKQWEEIIRKRQQTGVK